MPILRIGVVTLGTLLASVGAAVLYLAGNDWFGSGDLSAMLIWSLPLSLLVAAIAIPLRRPATRKGFWRYCIPLILGPSVGFGWTFVVAFLLGGWMGAFSFPVLFCWIFGSVIGLTLAAWLPQPRTWPIALTIAGLAVFGLLRANAYAQAPEPRVALYLKPGATGEEVQQVWESVLGRPSTTGEGHDLLPGISSVAATGREGDQEILTVSFLKGMKPEQLDSMLAMIRRSPLVQRVERVSVDDTSGVRSSVSY